MSQMDSPTELLPVRPYARLLTMLGEQLIKNDRVALVELIKNSYDADATLVRVGFNTASPTAPRSTSGVVELVLTDNGHGMTEKIIRDHWLNPATPTKLKAKAQMPTTLLGRVMQGEKGIGRFAMFKIATTAQVITRATDSSDEFVIDFDLSFLEREGDQGASSPEFVDQIKVGLTRRSPRVFDGANPLGMGASSGTRLVLTGLRSNWTQHAILTTYKDVSRLRPLVPPPAIEEVAPVAAPFEVEFVSNDKPLPYELEAELDLQILLDQRARFRVEGIFDADNRSFLLNVAGEDGEGGEYSIALSDPTIRALSTYRKAFDEEAEQRDLTCGPFHFAFFVFDLLGSAPNRFKLNKDEKDLIKSHRIYLYRDGVRVLPYGDAQDDWLQLDVIRGTKKADWVLSNDQTVGFVYITQKDNENLRDKTNREGLLDEGTAYTDFVAVLQVAVAHIRSRWFAPYLEDQKKQSRPRITPGRDSAGLINKVLADDDLPKKFTSTLKEAAKALRAERQLTAQQIERLEDLAGVGLSVETASHDIIAAGNRALRVGGIVRSNVDALTPPNQQLAKRTDSLIELVAFVASRLHDVQGLFVSTRQPPRALNVSEFALRVQRIYANALERQTVRVEVEDKYAELVVKTTDAALLQLLINLFDNALYWLDSAQTPNPRILVELDSASRRMIFADNGPGVPPEHDQYIFEPFYSGKDEEGKGLGLYIARQVGSRNGFDVALATSDKERILPGANFVIQFKESYE